MRTYEKEQVDSVMFDGEDASRIVQLRKTIDERSKEICGRLQEAYDLAEEEFKQLGIQTEPEFAEYFQGTKLENVPLSRIGFDFSGAEAHGVVFARETKYSPHEMLLDILRRTTEDGPSMSDDDRLYVEPKPDVAGAWGARGQRVSEPA
jgi:hypothetical protein